MSSGKRADTTGGALQAFADAMAPPLEPPAHIELSDDAWPFWFSIVKARARQLWDDLDLTHAAELAQTLADIREERRQLHAEGSTVENARGTPVVNPRGAFIETLVRRSLALSKHLHVHPEAKTGPARGSTKKTEEESKAREAAAALTDDDDLIPGIQ